MRPPRTGSPLAIAGLIIGMLLAGATGASADGAAFQAKDVAPAAGSNPVMTALRSRVGAPHPESVAAYRAAGAIGAAPHQVTDAEWARVEQALADLPPLHRRILEQRLDRLSFIDAPDSAGTALTRSFDGPDGRPLFEITLRADVLDKTLTEFLTAKERQLFVDDGSGLSVHVLAGDTPALTYVLLHEATHVIDRAFDVSNVRRPFAGIWRDYRSLSEPLADSLIAATPYRRAPRLPLSSAPALYEVLGRSPFVSVYATASAGEDLAELSTWSHLSDRCVTPLTVEVHDAAGRVLLAVEPLDTPAVRSRLDAVDGLLQDAAGRE